MRRGDYYITCCRADARNFAVSCVIGKYQTARIGFFTADRASSFDKVVRNLAVWNRNSIHFLASCAGATACAVFRAGRVIVRNVLTVRMSRLASDNGTRINAVAV